MERTGGVDVQDRLSFIGSPVLGGPGAFGILFGGGASIFQIVRTVGEEVLLESPVKRGDLFTIEYRHSSDHTPVRDLFTIGDEGEIVLIEESYRWYGAGLESHPEMGKTYFSGELDPGSHATGLSPLPASGRRSRQPCPDPSRSGNTAVVHCKGEGIGMDSHNEERQQTIEKEPAIPSSRRDGTGKRKRPWRRSAPKRCSMNSNGNANTGIFPPC